MGSMTWGRVARGGWGLRPALLAAVVVVLWGSGADAAVAVADDFNDGNDTGWTRYSPLGGLGAAGEFSFPDGGYRIQAPPSPAPSLAGPARAGSFREADSYSSFYTSIDVVDWDDTLDQSFGILSRVKEPGLGTTDGYAFTYSTDGPSIDLSLITNEDAVETLATFPVRILPTRDYRLVFEGDGTSLTGTLFDLEDLTTPLAVIQAVDDTYAQGFNGVFVFDNSASSALTADATFDNYVANVPEPGGAALLLALAFPWRRRA